MMQWFADVQEFVQTIGNSIYLIGDSSMAASIFLQERFTDLG